MKTQPQPLETQPVTSLRGVGPRLAERLARLGLATVLDLLFHLPLRYQDRSRRRPLGSLLPGEEAMIEGEVGEARISHGQRRTLKVWLADESGTLQLRFFHFGRTQTAAFTPGTRLRCFGEVRVGVPSLEMIHPEYQLLTGAAEEAQEEGLTPIYPTTEGLQQVSLRNLIAQALALLESDQAAGGLGPRELLPPEVLDPLLLPSLVAALRFLHHPPLEALGLDLNEHRHPAFRRLAFEELVAHQLALRRLRRQRQRLEAPVLAGGGDLRARLLVALPFGLTGAQRRVLEEISADLARPRPMLRLLQGDVGSGKTVVAALAALQAVESGRQAALMAPTEMLSEQHRRNLAAWLSPLGLAPAWLAGRHKGREREELLARIASGEARVVVGTHALFQEDVAFQDLGLAIVDEQHRFGVHQRMRLREKGSGEGGVPHQLIMTATPIPRSLAMTLYADLDLSVIDEMPPGRTPVTTVAVPDSRREEVMVRVREACASGRQAYWVCTLIEESEALQCQAAEETARSLAEALPGVRIGLAHGRLKAVEREAVMRHFAGGDLDLLVATTVIEVGVDVANASLMIIENPERLGLAQLHQLRGRVGRGAQASHCLLLYHAPLSRLARERIELLRRSTNGFEIAQKDLEMRGAGEVLGTRQTGEMQFRIANPVADESLLVAACQAADLILDRYRDRVTPLIDRWLGAREHCGGV
ncbi:MAG: ATP-dependent DNA helicase RecG [Chromatiaceae bacterium]|nr:ATP-dependent DNA helicase RecG [Chromatiaceae bacterium]